MHVSVDLVLGYDENPCLDQRWTELVCVCATGLNFAAVLQVLFLQIIIWLDLILVRKVVFSISIFRVLTRIQDEIWYQVFRGRG